MIHKSLSITLKLTSTLLFHRNQQHRMNLNAKTHHSMVQLPFENFVEEQRSKDDPTKYRGISIGSTVCKIIIKIILKRLRPWYESQLSDEQNGFRQNRGTTDGIFTLKRVQQITHKKLQLLYLLFVHVTAAFDHIPRGWLFKSIEASFQMVCFLAWLPYSRICINARNLHLMKWKQPLKPHPEFVKEDQRARPL